MNLSEPRLLPAGDSAILIEFTDEIDDTTNDRVHALAQFIRAQQRAEILDLVPAYSSLLVNYDSLQIDFALMRDYLAGSLSLLQSRIVPEPRVIEIPVQYGG
jgi:allophanate hydrolase subunit 1